MSNDQEKTGVTDTASSRTAVFVTGSTMRHVVVMTGTASIGLMAIFMVDFLSLLYVSWLGRPEATAGVGFATIILFFAMSINIGLMIGVTALTSRAIGAGDRDKARRIGGSSLTIMVVTGVVISIVIWPFLPNFLDMLGAKGEAHAIALRFLHITVPSNFLMAIGMGLSGTLRAVGDAKRAMYVTLAGGVATAALDPLLIFGLGMGVDGAAIATVISRIIFAAIGMHGAVKVHDMVARPRLSDMAKDARPLLGVAGPAILTNLATPVANAAVAALMAKFGDKAIAGIAIIDRLVPVAFGVLFAMSGAVGPILGQNWGARRYDRMRKALTDSVTLAGVYVMVMWAVLVLSRHAIADLFKATGLAAEIITLFCWISGPMWLGLGALFVANASFNNLGFPLYSTAFNWGRAILGAIPLAWLGSIYDGPRGVLLGVAIGAALFGFTALVMAYRVIGVLETNAKSKPATTP